MAEPNSLFTDLTVATLKARRKEIADNMSQHNALYRRMRERGNVRALSGGTTIVENLDYAENETFQRYAGYDALNISPSSVFSAAEYLWCQAAVHVTYSGREERVNKGSKERVFDLVKSRVDNAFLTAANAMNRDMYSAGTLPNQIGGLQLLVADNPQNMVGGISGATWNFWRNKILDLGTAGTGGTAVDLTADNILLYFNRMWVMNTRGAETPDFILISPDWFNIYEQSQQQLQRYMASENAKAGFMSLKYKSADVFFDQTIGPDGVTAIMPNNHAYFINTKYLRLREHADARWTPLEDKVSVNQDATVVPILWMGNMTCSNRFMQGVMIKSA
jgi:hypothetical protein